jgi:hypothetical protein
MVSIFRHVFTPSLLRSVGVCNAAFFCGSGAVPDAFFCIVILWHFHFSSLGAIRKTEGADLSAPSYQIQFAPTALVLGEPAFP